MLSSRVRMGSGKGKKKPRSITKLAGSGSYTGSGVAWSNVSRITAKDNNFATTSSSLIGASTSNLVGSNFGFSLPSNADIKGVEVKALAHNGKSTVDVHAKWYSQYLTKDGGSNFGPNYGHTSSIQRNTDTSITTLGGPANLWGMTLTPAIVNNNNFGVGIKFQQASPFSSVTIYVDYIEMTIHYEA